MKRRLIVECGAAETRFALFEDDRAIRFWFGPARGDEDLPRPPQTGDTFLGRVRKVSKPLRAAFIDIGAGIDGFLPIRTEKPPVEGAVITVNVRRPAIGAKGAVLTKETRETVMEDTTASKAPFRLSRTEDSAAFIFQQIDPSGIAAIHVDSGAAAAAIGQAMRLRGATAQIFIESDIFERNGAQEALGAALEREVALPHGVRLTVDETEAMTVIDVDAASFADGAGAQMNDRVNEIAARHVFAELTRRAIGGKIAIDFLPPSSAAARATLLSSLASEILRFQNARIGKLARDGMFDCTMPKSERSLLDLATELAGEGFVRPGRRFTLEWTARAVIRDLEKSLAAAPSAAFVLSAGEELHARLAARERWFQRLRLQFGERLQLIEEKNLGRRSSHVANR